MKFFKLFGFYQLNKGKLHMITIFLEKDFLFIHFISSKLKRTYQIKNGLQKNNGNKKKVF